MGAYDWLKSQFDTPAGRDFWNHHPGNVSMDSNQAGATMASRYTTAKYAAIIGASVFPVGALVRGGSAVKGSRALEIYGAVKRPVLTGGVYYGVRGATTAMTLSKAYSKMLFANSMFGVARNIHLAKTGQYRRLGVNIFGPPLSLFAYDHYMSRNNNNEKVRLAFEQVPVDSSLTSESKIRGNKRSTKKFLPGTTPYAYKPKRAERCRKGYKSELIMGRRMCVKID